MSHRVIHRLYKQLLHLARRYDAQASLKALIHPNPTSKLDTELLSKFFPPNQLSYVPHISMETCVKRAFHAPIHHEESTAIRLSLGFRALRYLNERIAFARMLGIISSNDVTLSVRNAPTLPDPTGEIQLLRRPQPGAFLLAHPLLSSPFHQSVILLLDHSDMAHGVGTFGVEINQHIPRGFLIGQDPSNDQQPKLPSILGSHGSTQEKPAGFVADSSTNTFQHHVGTQTSNDPSDIPSDSRAYARWLTSQIVSNRTGEATTSVPISSASSLSESSSDDTWEAPFYGSSHSMTSSSRSGSWRLRHPYMSKTVQSWRHKRRNNSNQMTVIRPDDDTIVVLNNYDSQTDRKTQFPRRSSSFNSKYRREIYRPLEPPPYTSHHSLGSSSNTSSHSSPNHVSAPSSMSPSSIRQYDKSFNLPVMHTASRGRRQVNKRRRRPWKHRSNEPTEPDILSFFAHTIPPSLTRQYASEHALENDQLSRCNDTNNEIQISSSVHSKRQNVQTGLAVYNGGPVETTPFGLHLPAWPGSRPVQLLQQTLQSFPQHDSTTTSTDTTTSFASKPPTTHRHPWEHPSSTINSTDEQNFTIGEDGSELRQTITNIQSNTENDSAWKYPSDRVHPSSTIASQHSRTQQELSLNESASSSFPLDVSVSSMQTAYNLESSADSTAFDSFLRQCQRTRSIHVSSKSVLDQALSTRGIENAVNDQELALFSSITTWAPGQLEQELTNGDWIIVAHPDPFSVIQECLEIKANLDTFRRENEFDNLIDQANFLNSTNDQTNVFNSTNDQTNMFDTSQQDRDQKDETTKDMYSKQPWYRFWNALGGEYASMATLPNIDIGLHPNAPNDYHTEYISDLHAMADADPDGFMDAVNALDVDSSDDEIISVTESSSSSDSSSSDDSSDEEDDSSDSDSDENNSSTKMNLDLLLSPKIWSYLEALENPTNDDEFMRNASKAIQDMEQRYSTIEQKSLPFQRNISLDSLQLPSKVSYPGQFETSFIDLLEAADAKEPFVPDRVKSFFEQTMDSSLKPVDSKSSDSSENEDR